MTAHDVSRKKTFRRLSESEPSLIATYPASVATRPEISVSRSSVIAQTSVPRTDAASTGVGDGLGAGRCPVVAVAPTTAANRTCTYNIAQVSTTRP